MTANALVLCVSQINKGYSECSLQARERELSEVRAEKEKSRLLAEDLQLKLRSSRREAEAISTTLRNAKRATK